MLEQLTNHILEGVEIFCAVAAFILAIVAYFDAKRIAKKLQYTNSRIQEHIDLYYDKHQEVRDMYAGVRHELNNHISVYYKRHEELRDMFLSLHDRINGINTQQPKENKLNGDDTSAVIIPFKSVAQKSG
jgi:predicted transcriptional regulator